MGGSLKRSFGLAETLQLCPPTGLLTAPASCQHKTEAGGVYRPDFPKHVSSQRIIRLDRDLAGW
jgi:hypothetical protein